MKLTLLLLTLTGTLHAVTPVLNVSEKRSSSAASTHGFVLHGNGEGSGFRVTGGWRWHPTVLADPVDVPTIVTGLSLTLGGTTDVDATILEVNVDRFHPTNVGFLAGLSPQGTAGLFKVWTWQDNGVLNLRLDEHNLVGLPDSNCPQIPEPSAALLGALGILGLLRRRH